MHVGLLSSEGLQEVQVGMSRRKAETQVLRDRAESAMLSRSVQRW